MAQETPMTPEEEQLKDLETLLNEADIAAGIIPGEGEGAPAPEEGAEMAEGAPADEALPEEGDVEAEAAPEDVDLGPLVETLGATEERAQMLYDAAQQIPTMEGKTPQELADLIASDFDVLMQLEMVAARGEGGAMDAPPAEGMMPAGPQGMPPGQMMPPEGM
jgi:hypothetical protein